MHHQEQFLILVHLVHQPHLYEVKSAGQSCGSYEIRVSSVSIRHLMPKTTAPPSVVLLRFQKFNRWYVQVNPEPAAIFVF
jgi:hypothetical protein